MRVRVLGSAAGGGSPQWNCSCGVCAGVRATGRERRQDTLAITGDDRGWYLVNASPDLRAQLLSMPDLVPAPGTRDTPLRGVILSTAELDHTVGLLTLREARRIDVYSTATVERALTDGLALGPAVGAYTDLRWHAMVPGEPVELAGGLVLTLLTIGVKKPRYAQEVDGTDWVSAVRLADSATGGVVVYATCLATWSHDLARLVESADLAILDGTFLRADDVRAIGRSSAGAMGHLPIVDSLVATRAAARPSGPRILYSHLNNTNPLLTMTGEQRAATLGPDVEVAQDGMEFLL